MILSIRTVYWSSEEAISLRSKHSRYLYPAFKNGIFFPPILKAPSSQHYSDANYV